MTVGQPGVGPRGRGPGASPRRGFRTRRLSASNAVVASGATAWFDGHDGSGLQVVNSRIGASAITLGSTTGVDTNDPTWGSNGWTFDATDDYMSSTADVPNVNATTGKHTALVAFITPASGSSPTFWASGAVISQRFMIYRTGTTISAYARGTTTAVQVGTTWTTTAGIPTVVGIVIDTGNIYSYVYQSGVGTLSAATSITGVGTISGLTSPAYGNTHPASLVNPMNGKMYAAVEYKDLALAKADMDTVSAYLLSTFP